MPKTQRHTLTELETEKAVAVCAVCGPTAVKLRKGLSPRCRQRVNLEKRWEHLRRKYGISRQEYERRLEEQNGGCAICGEAPPEDSWLSVDHDHETGNVRGLLCPPCNFGIGQLRDSIPLLRAAIAYLEP